MRSAVSHKIRAISLFSKKPLWATEGHGFTRIGSEVCSYLSFEDHHSLPEMQLVRILQPRSTGVAVDFLAHPVSHDPDSALARADAALVPAVVEEAVFARSPVELNVGVLA